MTGLISVPKLYLQRFVYNPTLGQCILLGYHEPGSGFSVTLNLADKLFGLGGMVCLVICNTLLIVIDNKRRTVMVKKGAWRRSNNEGPDSLPSPRPVQKLTLIAAAVMFVFIISVLPYFTMKMIFHVRKDWLLKPLQPWFRRTIISSYFLMHVSSSVNPVLYVLQGCSFSRLSRLKFTLKLFESASRPVAAIQRKGSSNAVAFPEGASTSWQGFTGSKDRLCSRSKEHFERATITLELHNVCQARDFIVESDKDSDT